MSAIRQEKLSVLPAALNFIGKQQNKFPACVCRWGVREEGVLYPRHIQKNC